MRRLFAELLLKEMHCNQRIVLVSADMGFGIWDEVRDKYVDRFFNVGAAEQAGAGICVGMALSGKIPIFYSITSFLLCRPFEFWRNYMAYEGVGVKLVGSGRDQDYLHDGFTHWAADDHAIMALWPGIQAFWPNDESDLRKIVSPFLLSNGPSYLNLKRQCVNTE